MAFRLAYADRDPAPSKATRPVKRKDYLSFIHDLPCVVTGARPVQAAHLSAGNLECGHFGRGKGRKASDRWVLPLCEAEHRRQHSMNEEVYWQKVNIDPYRLALALFGLWSDLGDEAFPFAVKIINASRRRP